MRWVLPCRYATAEWQALQRWLVRHSGGERSVELWYAQASAGARGHKQMVREIVDSLDRDSVLREAR